MIDVIVPVYNSEKYVAACIESILAQTYTNFRLILVDDGTPDRAGAICDEYAKKDNRITIIHQENSGVVNARNRAIGAGTSKYLAFVDSDDTIEPTMLEELHTLAERERLDIAYCNINAIYNDNTTCKVNIAATENGDKGIKMLLSGKLPGWMWNKLIRRDFWERCNITTDEKAVVMEDTYILVQLFAHDPKIKSINSHLYNYNRANENAATATSDDVIIKAHKNIDNIHNWLVEKGIFHQYKKDFAHIAMTLKIGLLKKDIKQAVECYPYAHQKFSNFKFSFLVSVFYWFCFNSGCLGKSLFKIYFKAK